MAKITNQEYQNVQNYVNSNYTADSIKNYTNAYNQYMAQGMSSNDAYSKASSLLVKNGATASTPTQATPTTSNNRATTNTQPTQTATSTPTSTQSTQSQNTTSTSSPISDNGATRKWWDNLSYEQQQEKLKQVPWLKDALNKRWWTIKTADWQTVQQTTPQQSNVSNDWWDYQDNSPERMGQIVDNLEKMYQTDPWLFANEQTFKNFFINWKGRSPEQEQFLLDYYKNRNAYNQYDLLQPDKVWVMAANWQGWDTLNSYLNYLKNSNPQRYQEVMAAEQQEEDRIGNNTSYSDMLKQAGFEDTANTAWQKKEWLLVDENNDLIDDRLYHEPTAEEREKVDRINEIDSEVLDIENTYKHTYDDLVEKYPWATKATLMAMAQDRCSDLLRRKEDLMVERTKLAWTVEYLQNERQAQNDAGKQTIANLQKNLWMYYDYSPEWMAEYAQNQYAATNITLDQADNWTDTQKQMALQSVLDGYYDKYWSIIQRSEQQVIWDVMKYAKDNWVSLSQALEENFLKPLRSKPQFQTLSSGGITPNVSLQKIWDTGYVFTVNPDGTYSIEQVWWGASSDWLYWFTDYTPISTQEKESKLNDFISQHPADTTWWQCGSFVNDYLQSLWYDRLYTDPIDKKKAITNSDTPTVWSVAVMDSKKYPQYWHVAIVTEVNGDKVKLLESNWWDDKKVHNTRWVNKSDIAWYFDPSKAQTNGWNAWNGGNYDPALEPFLKADPTKFSSTQWKTIKNMWYSEKQFMQIRTGYLKNLASTPDASTKKILDTLWALITNYPWELALKSTMLWTDYVNTSLGNYIADYDFVKQNLTMENLTRLKSQWATFGSLTEWERPRIENSASKLNKNKMSESAFKQELLDIYNTYAEKSWMGTLTLDDINNMYGKWGSSSSNNIQFNAPSYASQNYWAWSTSWDINWAEVRKNS